MESDGSGGGVAAAVITPQAIPSQPSTLGEFFTASDLKDSSSAINLIISTNNNYDNVDDDDDQNNNTKTKDNAYNPRMISGLTLGDVLSIDSEKKQRLFSRSKPTPNARFFRNPRVLLSNRSKVAINQIFSREKKPSSSSPPPPAAKVSLGAALEVENKPPPNKPLFLRSLLSSIRNNETFRVRSALRRKPAKSSKLDLKSNQESVCYSSYSNEDEYQILNQGLTEEIRQSLKGESLDSASFREYDFEAFSTVSDHGELGLKEVIDSTEESLKSSSSFKLLTMEGVIVKKEKTQRKFSRELFVLWCLIVGCLSFFLFLFFAYLS